MTTLYCAECRSRFEPDDRHVWIQGETRSVNDRNRLEDFAMCPDCWADLTEDWGEPV